MTPWRPSARERSPGRSAVGLCLVVVPRRRPQDPAISPSVGSSFVVVVVVPTLPQQPSRCGSSAVVAKPARRGRVKQKKNRACRNVSPRWSSTEAGVVVLMMRRKRSKRVSHSAKEGRRKTGKEGRKSCFAGCGGPGSDRYPVHHHQTHTHLLNSTES